MELFLALIGIVISIFITVKWWKIVLPFVGVLLLIIVVVVSYAAYKKNDIEATRAALISDINEAKERATSIDKKWISGQGTNIKTNTKYISTVSITSNDGFCILSVMEDYSHIECPRLNLKYYENIWVKFSGDYKNKEMDADPILNSHKMESVPAFFIPSLQPHNFQFTYEDFIKGLNTRRYVDIRIGIKDMDSEWFRFQVENNHQLLQDLGKPFNTVNTKNDS